MSGERHPRAGVASAVAAFLMWGLFPLYWKQVASVPALEIVAHRTAWAFVFVAAWVTLARRLAPGRGSRGEPPHAARARDRGAC